MEDIQDCVKVVEITEENFESEFTNIQKVVHESAFVSFDMEFSGLESKSFHKSVTVDSFDTRYCKMKQSVETYFPLQLGLSFFRFNDSKQRYDCTIYNIFMNPYSHNSLDDSISIRPGTISFLKSNHFDFNKAFLHGVSSLRRNDEKKLLDEIETSNVGNTPAEKLEINKNNMRIVKSALDKIKEWIEVIKNGSEEKRQEIPQWEGKYYLVLDPVNSYIRRLYYQEIESTFGSLLSVVKLDEDNQHCTGNSRRLRVIYNVKDGQDESAAVATNVKGVKIQEVKKLVGIRRILELITGKRLPLVGYEILNDLMFLYHWCIDRLPEKCQDFLRSISNDFPLIVDVHSLLKIKSCSDILPESQSLSSVYQAFALMNPPSIQEVKADNQQAHDAGFDAYMAGAVFIRLGYKFQLEKKDILDLHTFISTPLSTSGLDNIYYRQPVQFQYGLNVVNMYNLQFGMPINQDEFKVKQQELVEEYNKNVVLVTDFEESVKTSDFVGLFRNYLNLNERVQIIWLDQQYLLLHFPTDEVSTKIQEDYKNLHTQKETDHFGFHSFTFLPYSKYEELCGARKPTVTSVKREASEMLHEETVFETKRYRLSRIKRPERKRMSCQIM